MKVKGEVLNDLRYEDEIDDFDGVVVHRAHIDETRWGQVYEAVVQVLEQPALEYTYYRFTYEEASTEMQDPSAYEFDDDEEIELERVVPTQKVVTVYVKAA